MIRNDWKLEEIETLYQMPLMQLVAQAHQIHLQFHTLGEVQVCKLISIKTGGCPENCNYCAQSAHHTTAVKSEPFANYEAVMRTARSAVERGASRVCLGAAWRAPRKSKQFDEVLRMVSGIREMGAEVCCTLGMLQKEQAEELKEAGLYAYNHNLDTSERYYPEVVSTRSYQERLDTLDVVEEADLQVCCGGILGLGEEVHDRLQLLHTLATRNPHPESVPINQLTRVQGTPFESNNEISFWEFLRIVAIARIVMPKAIVRLSAGRDRMTQEQQALSFFAGANSLFMDSVLFTIPNPAHDADEELFHLLGLTRREPFQKA